MTWQYILSQIFVSFAILALGSTYLLKNKKTILLFSILVSILYAMHYAFLFAWTGFAVNTISIFRALFFLFLSKYGKTQQWYSITIVSALYVVATVFTWSSWISILPLIAGLIYTYSIWQENILVYRWSPFIINACWITYNALLSSFMGILCECVILLMEIIGLILFYKNKKKEIEKTPIQTITNA